MSGFDGSLPWALRHMRTKHSANKIAAKSIRDMPKVDPTDPMTIRYQIGNGKTGDQTHRCDNVRQDRVSLHKVRKVSWENQRLHEASTVSGFCGTMTAAFTATAVHRSGDPI